MKKLPKKRSSSHDMSVVMHNIKQGLSNSGEKAGRITQYMSNLRKPKYTKVNL